MRYVPLAALAALGRLGLVEKQSQTDKVLAPLSVM
jgi:hypothetical protein